MFPAIHFNWIEIERWSEEGLPALYRHTERLRKALKKATDYTWDNSHFYIEDLFGKVVLTVQFHPELVSFWIYRTGVSAAMFNAKTLTAEALKDLVANASKNLTPCNACGKWIPNDKVKHYSFAGGVCPKCYNPKRHLPPDTRGD